MPPCWHTGRPALARWESAAADKSSRHVRTKRHAFRRKKADAELTVDVCVPLPLHAAVLARRIRWAWAGRCTQCQNTTASSHE
jgi:hypothetical protein